MGPKQHSTEPGMGTFTEENMKAFKNRDGGVKEEIARDCWTCTGHTGLWTQEKYLFLDPSWAAQQLGLLVLDSCGIKSVVHEAQFPTTRVSSPPR